MAARRVDALLTDYASYHRTRGNLVCHAFGITLIVYGIVALLREVPLGAKGWTVAEVLVGVSILFYATLSPWLAAAMLAESASLDFLARAVADWRVGLAAFAVGWVFQGIGHARYEKNRPAFFKNFVHLMVGPLFLLNELLRVRPLPEERGASK
jgi:uncharacterized membrane protein YGL010W